MGKSDEKSLCPPQCPTLGGQLSISAPPIKVPWIRPWAAAPPAPPVDTPLLNDLNYGNVLYNSYLSKSIETN